MQVTDEMVAAALRVLFGPGATPDAALRAKVCDAMQAALDAMPKATGGVVEGPASLPRAGCMGEGYMLPLKTPLTVTPGTTVTVALKVDPQNAAEVVVEDLRIDVRHGEPVKVPEVAPTRPVSITVPAGRPLEVGRHWIPVTEPRPLATVSQLHHHIGESLEFVLRAIVHGDDYDPPFPEPVRLYGEDREPLYDPDAVKAWYDALPQAADG